MSNTKKNYIDSNVFIYPLLYEDDESKVYAEFLAHIAEGKINACTSTLVWDEIVYSLRKMRGKEIAKVEGKKLLNFPNLQFLVVNEKTLRRAQEIVEKYDLRPRDAIHAASALLTNAENIISGDGDFDKIVEIKRKTPAEIVANKEAREEKIA